MSSEDYSYVSRLQMLQAEKLKEAEETRQLFGAMDHDEWGIVLPPESSREVVETVSASGSSAEMCCSILSPWSQITETATFTEQRPSAEIIGRSSKTILCSSISRALWREPT